MTAAFRGRAWLWSCATPYTPMESSTGTYYRKIQVNFALQSRGFRRSWTIYYSSAVQASYSSSAWGRSLLKPVPIAKPPAFRDWQTPRFWNQSHSVFGFARSNYFLIQFHPGWRRSVYPTQVVIHQRCCLKHWLSLVHSACRLWISGQTLALS